MDEANLIEESRLLKNRKNALIMTVHDKLGVLRTLAYRENQVEWFHRMNELCIWMGDQLEYLVRYREATKEELSEAVITP